MARVPRRPVPKHKHKVIHERVPKKKLQTQPTIDLVSPLNYTLVPAGNPKLTTACKDVCRQKGLLVYVVTKLADYDRRNQSSSNALKFLLSHHVNRLGYHFPTWVVTSSCENLGIPLKTVDEAIKNAFLPAEHFFDPMEQYMSQDQINEKAQNAIKDLFPAIPDADLVAIIQRTFKKDSDRVGANRTLSWSRRASMAVLAHIRHVHTPYDLILQGKDGWGRLNWTDARRQIEPICVDKLISWRGPDENGLEDFEDVLREVIVISDGEDEDEEAPPTNEVIHISSSPINPISHSPITKQSSSQMIVDTNRTLKRKYESDPDSTEQFVRGRRNEIMSPTASHAPGSYGAFSPQFDSSYMQGHQVAVGIPFGYAPFDSMEPIPRYTRAHVQPQLTRQNLAVNHQSPPLPNVDSRHLRPWGMGLPIRPAPTDSNMPVFVSGYNDIHRSFEYQNPRPSPVFEAPSQIPVSRNDNLDTRYAGEYVGSPFPVAGYVIHPRLLEAPRPLTTRYADGFIRPVEILPPGVRIIQNFDPLSDRWSKSLEPLEPQIRRRL